MLATVARCQGLNLLHEAVPRAQRVTILLVSEIRHQFVHCKKSSLRRGSLRVHEARTRIRK